MDTVDPLRFIFAFLFVIGLIAGMAFLLRRYGSARNIFAAKEEGGRIEVVETRYLDPKRRVTLIRRDDVEHLMLLADGREMIIESNIRTKHE